VLEGATALSEAELSPAWSRYLGQTISIATLYDIANAVSEAYTRAGYALSFALLPEQDITDGRVRIAVVEGFVDEVVVSGGTVSGGSVFALGRHVEAQMALIKASRPLKTAALERALLLLNDIPGVRARAVFSASPRTRNASTMTVELERTQITGEAGVNNRLSEALGQWRAGATVRFNGVIGETSGLSLTAYHALDGDGFVYGAGRFEQPLSTDGLSLALSGSYSKDVPLEGLLKTLDFEGENVMAGLELSYPLIRSRPQNLTLSAALNYADSKARALAAPLTEDKIRTLEAAITWDVADAWAGISLLQFSVTQGFDVAGATSDASSLKSRANGSATFTSAELYGSRVQPLFGNVSLFAAIEMQAALFDPLLSLSECSYGGQSFGRGYDAGALSGDHCAIGLVEARLDEAVGGVEVQFYSFMDAAVVLQKGALEPGERRHEQTSSAGGGVRVFITPQLNVAAEVALPLRERFAPGGDGEARAFFSATARF
jgi:hemolysin activation/secretion protein